LTIRLAGNVRRNVMVVWEKLFFSIVFPTCVSIPSFQKFEMGQKSLRIA
jgi:hypothetical protein